MPWIFLTCHTILPHNIYATRLRRNSERALKDMPTFQGPFSLMDLFYTHKCRSAYIYLFSVKNVYAGGETFQGAVRADKASVGGVHIPGR